MPIPRIGKLQSGNVKRLVQTFHRNNALKKEAITQMKRSFPRFLEIAFDLTPSQRKEMRRALPGPIARGLAHAVIATLEFGGDIEYKVVQGSPKITYGIEGSYGTGGQLQVKATVKYEK